MAALVSECCSFLWGRDSAAAPGVGGFHGLGLAQLHLPCHILTMWGHLCHSKTFYPDQQSKDQQLHGAVEFQEESLGPCHRQAWGAVCFCGAAELSTHLWGVIFEGMMQHGSGAGVGTPGSIPCPVLGWEVVAGCCLSHQPGTSFPPEHFRTVLIP